MIAAFAQAAVDAMSAAAVCATGLSMSVVAALDLVDSFLGLNLGGLPRFKRTSAAFMWLDRCRLAGHEFLAGFNPFTAHRQMSPTGRFPTYEPWHAGLSAHNQFDGNKSTDVEFAVLRRAEHVNLFCKVQQGMGYRFHSRRR